jgi:hypothetical protein
VTRLAIGFLMAAVAASGGVAAAARPEQATFPPQRLGLKVVLGDGVDMGDFAGRGSTLFSYLRDCGISLTRVGVSWDQMEKTRGSYDWSEADELVNFWWERGIEFHLTMIGAPTWARRTDPSDAERGPRSGVPYISLDLPRDQYLAQLSNWAEAVARRYRGKVRYFEWWNEPDGIPGPVILRNAQGEIIGGRTGGDPVRYARTLKAVHDGLKRGNPEAMLAAGSLSIGIPNSSPGAFPTDGGFMEAIYATVGKDAFEAITYHPYSSQGLDTAWTEALRALCVRNGDLDCQLWANEWSWNSKSRAKVTATYGVGPAAEERPRDGITLGAQYPYLTQSYLHTLNDWSGAGYVEGNPDSGFGLLDIALRPKPKYEAFKESARWRRDALSRELTVVGPHVVFAGQTLELGFEKATAAQLGKVTWSVPEGWTVAPAGGDGSYVFRCPADAASAKPYPLTAQREDGLGFTHYVEVVEPVQLTRAVVAEAAHGDSPAQVEVVVRNLTSKPITAAPAFDLPPGWRWRDRAGRSLPPESESTWLVAVSAEASVGPGVYPCQAFVSHGGRTTGGYYLMLKKAASARFARAPIRADGDLGEWAGADWVPIPGDTAARFATAWDSRGLYLACVVEDAVHVQTKAPQDMWQQDCLQVAIDAACDAVPGSLYSDNDYEVETGLLDDGRSAVYRLHAPADSYGGELDTVGAKVVRAEGATTYEVAIPWAEIKPAKPKQGSAIGLTVVVGNKDEGDTTWGSWGSGVVSVKRPINFGRVRLAPAGPRG